MNFKPWLLLTEAKEEKALTLELAGSQHNYDELIKVTPKDNDQILLLAAYYLNQSKNLEQTKIDILDYIKLFKAQKMQLITVDLTTKQPASPFDNYLHFTQIIHGKQGEEKHKIKYTPTDLDFQNEQPIEVSSDKQIKVYLSNNPQQCIILGKGRRFCISQPGNTIWQSYRDRNVSTFYFVYDHTRDDDLSIVVVDATDDYFVLTDINNTTGKIQNPYDLNKKDTNPQIYLDYLKSKGIDIDVFENIPKTKEEEEEHEKLGKINQNLDWFKSLSPEEKSKYIGRGHKLSDRQFDYLWDNDFNSLLEQYVKIGSRIGDHQLNKIKTNKNLRDKYTHNRLIAHEATNQFDFENKLDKREFIILSPIQKQKFIESSTDENDFWNLIRIGENKEIIEDIVKYKKEFNSRTTRHLLLYYEHPKKLEAIIKSENVNQWSDFDVYDLLYEGKNKEEIAEILLKYKTELSQRNIIDLISYSKNLKKIEGFEEMLKSHINKLDDEVIYNILKNNMNYLEKAQIKEKFELINKYYTNKTPKIQELIDRELHHNPLIDS